jgi:D-methionine transport system ATP-binding protein
MSFLEIRHLSKSYDDKLVLNDVSLNIEKGDIYGILGLSGAGKSTLVRCINSLEDFDSGEILYEGKTLCSPHNPIKREERRKIGMIFQSFNLLQQKTVLSNVMLGLKINHVEKKERMALALDALKRVGLEDKKDAYPSQLSGGQQQRVAIARVLALKPEVILSDEATSALDNENTMSILSLLKSLNEEYGLTILMISHQMNVIENICNKVAIIDHANIIEEGNLSDVFLNPKSDVTRKLVYSNKVNTALDNHNLIRILFDGNVDEPLISNIVTECGIAVSIVYASSQVIDGFVYGQTLIKSPKNEAEREKLKKYLNLKNVRFEEVENAD